MWCDLDNTSLLEHRISVVPRQRHYNQPEFKSTPTTAPNFGQVYQNKYLRKNK
jgi:hypothetical protein